MREGDANKLHSDKEEKTQPTGHNMQADQEVKRHQVAHLEKPLVEDDWEMKRHQVANWLEPQEIIPWMPQEKEFGWLVYEGKN
nr:hypothetical protein CFP56_78446 [Quercus suber]